MNSSEEQKVLRAALKLLESAGRKRFGPALLLEILAMAGLALTAYWVSAQPRGPDWVVVLFLALSFVSGVALGCLSLWRALAHRGPLIRPYIDQDRMRARLSELDA
jgi:hypothetical protein